MSWRSYQRLTEGELSINGAFRGNILEFGFSDHYFFFFLRKTVGNTKQTIGIGPYFTIFLPLLDLLSELTPLQLSTGEGTSYSYKETKIGKMEINWDRMAADDGEITREILQLKLSLRKDTDTFCISMIGETGPVDPKSILDASPEHMKPCSFQVSFLLRRDHIETMLAGHPLQAKLLHQFSM